MNEVTRQTNHETLTRVLEVFMELNFHHRFMTETWD